MININYFSNSRLEFFDLTFYFINKIKSENKEKIKINILAPQSKLHILQSKIPNYPTLKINLVTFPDGMYYINKLNYCMNLPEEYSIKLDEDCIVNNYIWDYMIENVNILDNDENLLLSPLLSTAFPACEFFIDKFLNRDQRLTIVGHYLMQEMPNGLFGVDYSPLNSCTINAVDWDYKAYFKALGELNTEKKGIHPLRISYKGQIAINEFILEKYEDICKKNEYNIMEINTPYFTNNLFMMKTKLWKHIFETGGGEYDEIGISNYKRANNKKFLFVDNGFGIHTFFNTCYGNNNPWGIGCVDAEEREKEFVEKLSKLIIK